MGPFASAPTAIGAHRGAPTRDTGVAGSIHTPWMDPQHARELLARERARVEGALAALPAPDSADVTDPFEASDVSPELFDEELDEARAEQLRDELDAIGQAERRLGDGTYGVSVESGEPIPDARLEAIPWAERTAEEQAAYEAPGA